MRLFVGILAVAAATPAFAQSGPSFDCAKASTAVERTICKSPELAKEDRAMAAAYAKLRDRLSGAARAHFEKDQLAWLGRRGGPCARDLADCLLTAYGLRLDRLQVLGTGAYPFISDQAIVRSGKVGKTSYTIDAVWPQFDGTTADFSAVNRRFADEARKGVAEATPTASDDGPQWDYGQDFTLYRPSARALSVLTRVSMYTGGAHPNGFARATLVDLASGRAVVVPSAVFASDDGLRAVAEIVRGDLKKEFAARPGFDDALEPAKLAKLLADPSRWLFGKNELTILFNSYDVGSYAAGPYEVEIPYDRIRRFFRADGPLGR